MNGAINLSIQRPNQRSIPLTFQLNQPADQSEPADGFSFYIPSGTKYKTQKVCARRMNCRAVKNKPTRPAVEQMKRRSKQRQPNSTTSSIRGRPVLFGFGFVCWFSPDDRSRTPLVHPTTSTTATKTIRRNALGTVASCPLCVAVVLSADASAALCGGDNKRAATASGDWQLARDQLTMCEHSMKM